MNALVISCILSLGLLIIVFVIACYIVINSIVSYKTPKKKRRHLKLVK